MPVVLEEAHLVSASSLIPIRLTSSRLKNDETSQFVPMTQDECIQYSDRAQLYLKQNIILAII